MKRARPFFVWHGCTRWVLMAWLCVVLGSVASPWARAQAGEREVLCSASGAMLLLPSPGEQLLGDAPAPHALDCPLCLPLLAPPLAWQAVRKGTTPPAPPVAPHIPTPRTYRTAAALKARGPPLGV